MRRGIIQAPRYDGFCSASERATRSVGANKACDTKCERLLRARLWRAGLRFRKNWASLPGRPDIVFLRERVVVFCDGDFWHGKDWSRRRRKLLMGSNSEYWLRKIESNKRRDERQNRELRAEGWTVVRMWESEISRDPEGVAAKVAKVVLAVGTRDRSMKRVRRQAEG
jgi:DNA mismatch endonuclease, patch repair protein